MKMDSLAHAAIDQLTLVSLRLEPCRVAEQHQYVMQPAPVERFVYITRGQVCFRLGNTCLEAGSRDMIYLPRDTAYCSHWLMESAYIVMDILLTDGNGQEIRFGDAPCVLFHDTHGAYDGLLAELADKAEATGPFDWLERLSLCFQLLCRMARDTNRQELDRNQQRLQAALSYLQSNYASDFSVSVLAEMCALSPTAFRRLFISTQGMPPVDYRNRLRIRKAAELLSTGLYTVAETAELVGIRDMKYFSKLFKRYMGMPPSQLKKGI